MPVKIGSFEAFSEGGFKALRQQKWGTSNSAMVELLNEAEFFAHLVLYVRDNEDELIRVAAPQQWDQPLARTF